MKINTYQKVTFLCIFNNKNTIKTFIQNECQVKNSCRNINTNPSKWIKGIQNIKIKKNSLAVKES